MISPSTDALDDLLGRLERAGFGAHVRRVRLGFRAATHQGMLTRGFVLEIPDGRITIRPPTGEREGPEGTLVAEVVLDDGKRTFVRASNSPERDKGRPRRSVRIDDETWAALGAHGEPSEVIREAIALYLASRAR